MPTPVSGCATSTRTNMLSHFEHFLATVPLASAPPGFTGLTIRAVDFTETPLEEYDLRGYVTTPEEIVESGEGTSLRRCVLRSCGAMGPVDSRQGIRELEEEARAPGPFLLWPRIRSRRVCRIGTLHGRSRFRAPVHGPRGAARRRKARAWRSRSIPKRRGS